MPAPNLISLAKAQGAVAQLRTQNSELRTQNFFERPWDYPVSVALPHYETPETLPVLLELLRLQTVRSYVLLIDTGSSWKTVRELERLRAADCEIHYLRARQYRHSSAPVTTALDTAWPLCRNEYLFLTHTDVFPVRRDLLAWLLSLCNARAARRGLRDVAATRHQWLAQCGLAHLHPPAHADHETDRGTWSFEDTGNRARQPRRERATRTRSSPLTAACAEQGSTRTSSATTRTARV